MLVFYSGYGKWEHIEECMPSNALEPQHYFMPLSDVVYGNGLFVLPDNNRKEIIYAGQSFVNYLLPCTCHADGVYLEDDKENKLGAYFTLYGDRSEQQGKLFNKDSIVVSNEVTNRNTDDPSLDELNTWQEFRHKVETAIKGYPAWSEKIDPRLIKKTGNLLEWVKKYVSTTDREAQMIVIFLSERFNIK